MQLMMVCENFKSESINNYNNLTDVKFKTTFFRKDEPTHQTTRNKNLTYKGVKQG